MLLNKAAVWYIGLVNMNSHTNVALFLCNAVMLSGSRVSTMEQILPSGATPSTIAFQHPDKVNSYRTGALLSFLFPV